MKESKETLNQRIKENLTPEQLQDLKDFYVERLVDNMSTKDLVRYVFDDMTDYVNSGGKMKIELNETEQQYLIDSMMFYSTFMQYFKNDNRGSYSRLIKQYQYWYDKDDRKECQQIFEKVLKAN